MLLLEPEELPEVEPLVEEDELPDPEDEPEVLPDVELEPLDEAEPLPEDSVTSVTVTSPHEVATLPAVSIAEMPNETNELVS